MKSMETKLKWIGLDEELPPVDSDAYYEELPGIGEWFALSEIVLITDGKSIYSATYIFDWNKYPWLECNGIGFCGDEFYYWCREDDLILPKKPEIVSSIDENKKYTLKQLHQAWGAGFHEGKK